MSDNKRFEHPVLEDTVGALHAIQEAEAHLRNAKLKLQEAIYSLPEKIGDNEDLRDEIFHNLYWFAEDINATWLKDAFQFKHASQTKKDSLNRLMKSAYLEIICIECNQPYRVKVTSRSDLQMRRGWVERARQNPGPYSGSWSITCDACKAKHDVESSAIYEQRQEEERLRIIELRTMPYYEYLQTPEWQERRKQAMKWAGFRCQVCNAYGVKLNTHHRTYERRGNENNRDLITLCEDCHRTFHENGRLATVEA